MGDDAKKMSSNKMKNLLYLFPFNRWLTLRNNSLHCIVFVDLAKKSRFYCQSSGSYFHFIEQPIEAIRLSVPLPVQKIFSIALNNSGIWSPSLPIIRLFNHPRYCSSNLALNPKKSGVHTAP